MIKLKAYYQTLSDLQKAEEPYGSVLRIIDKMKIMKFEGSIEVSLRFKNHLALSCVRTIVEELIQNDRCFVSEMKRLWISLYYARDLGCNDFNNYSVPSDHYKGIIFGGVYYVLSINKSVGEDYLSIMESYVKEYPDAVPYFEVFKNAVDKRTPSPSTTTENGNASLDMQKEFEKLKKENERMKKLIEEYTGQKEYKKPYFNTNQIAIATYFLFHEKVNVMDNQLSWSVIVSKISRRNAQNIRTCFGDINTDLLKLKDDAEIVAKSLDDINPFLADKIRNNFEIEANDEKK